MKRSLISLIGLALLSASPSYAQYSFTPLGDLPGASFSSFAGGVSSDGSVVVGYSHAASGTEVVRWTSSGIEALQDRAFDSRANDVSGDGTVIVGHSYLGGTPEAFRWANGLLARIGDLPGGSFSSVAHGVSPNGRIIVGSGSSSSGAEAFRWENGVMVGLGDLPGGLFQSFALGVSGDGSVVVGQTSTDQGYQGFIWTSGGGIVGMHEFLVSKGLNLTGWSLNSASAVSADGTTVVGYGTNPKGGTEAWMARIATIPEPSTYGAILGGVALISVAFGRLRKARK